MVRYEDCFCSESVAFMCTGYKHDGITDAEGELSAGVHKSGDSEVGQREQSTALTHITTVEE